MIYNHLDILNLETRFRANFINSLGGFKSLVLVGTKSPENQENLAVFSSLFHLGANPALCGIIVRPNEEKQNTLGNIVNTRYYTLNHINPSFYKQAHQCSAKYPEGISEFAQVGLNAEYVEGIVAPFVKESRIKFACELVQKIDIELNGTFLIIGKMIKIIVPDEYIQKDGFVDLEAAETVTVSGLDSYHTTQKMARLSYAKVDKPVVEI
ncbi:MAG: flavin reductase [Microscillaceae bacterium]|jgi:flavin reductase (DIM6/NTAB) family NADH-FMN oxidoreductase RutF|nr:flavin reductase [Microscillaceae bacterium]